MMEFFRKYSLRTFIEFSFATRISEPDMRRPQHSRALARCVGLSLGGDEYQSIAAGSSP
jgi:hypothetical protein